MRKIIALATAVPALALILFTASPVRADEGANMNEHACQGRIAEVHTEWSKSPLPTNKVREATYNRRSGHDHPAMVSSYMRRHLETAEKLCKDGKDHEALLHLDLVRAWLKLPFEEHPTSHNYHPMTKTN